MTLSLRRWRYRYPAQQHWALDGIDLDIRAGEVTWLAGAIGSGTSTLLLSLAGLAPRLIGGESSGTAEYHGLPLGERSPLLDGIGYLGASPALQLSGIARTVRDEIGVGPANVGRPAVEIVRAVDGALERLNLTGLAARAPGSLSGGETQRVLLASLLASQPSLWLLDEPFSALDHASTRHAQHLLRDLASTGATVVIACDDADLMSGIADRLVVMRHGRVGLDGAPAQLLAGDDLAATGAGTTDAAALAQLIGIPAPRPLTRDQLVALIPLPMAPAAPTRRGSGLATGEVVLQVDRVAFAYPGGPPVLRDVSVAVRSGEAVGVFGANGAGKSTLLRLAMALEHPAAGSVTALGTSTAKRHPEDLAPRVAFLFQQAERQLFARTVEAECSLAPRLAGWSGAAIASAVAATLEQLGLSDTAIQHPYDLPLPTRRLVALAAVLTADPALMLLDEPTAGLDAASRQRVIRVIRERTSAGRAVMVITHDPLFAHEALDRGILLSDGHVAEDGGLREIMDDRRMLRPAALAVAMQMGLPPGFDRRADVVRHWRR